MELLEGVDRGEAVIWLQYMREEFFFKGVNYRDNG